MNPVHSTTVSHLATQSRTFYETLFLNALATFKNGILHLQLPNGGSYIAGGQAGVEARIKIHDTDFFRRCVLYGDIGLAETYIDGLWDTDSIERVITWAISNVEDRPGEPPRSSHRVLNLLKFVNRLGHLLRPNSVSTCRRNISEHYDLGNGFYSLWLDSTMTYSSAYFTADDQSLLSAQSSKYERLCRQLRLKSGDHVLEIGCGWGGFSEHAASHYGCKVTAVTISAEQYRFASERMLRAGLQDLVEIRLEDYRHVQGKFDKIVSIEMMEALGDRYLPVFCRQINRLLNPDGIVALQYITVPDCRHPRLRKGVDFIQKHIFPGSLLLSVGRVNEILNRTGDLFLHDLKDLGSSYARTLKAWRISFNARTPEILKSGFDEHFLRKWNYYLQYCEAAFAMRNISVVQAIYTRPNNLNLE